MSVSNILQKLNSRDTKLIPQLPKLNKKIKFVSILIAFIFLGFLGHKILAADTAIEKFKAKQAAMDKGNNQESWMNESMMSNAMSLNTAIAGTIPDSVLNGTVTSWIPGGMIGFTNNAIATLYNPPASGVQYIAQTVNNFLGKPAYATTGYDGLKGILPIWQSFRNAVYILFSVVFIGIGIAIMLRVKISQQAVISIQSAIPSLITSLILVTFSYAIAGLLIDLSYVFQGIFLSIIFNGNTSILGDKTLTLSTLMTPGFNVISNLAMKSIPTFAIFALLTGLTTAIVGGFIGITAGAGAVAAGGAAIAAEAAATSVWPIIGIGALALGLVMLVIYFMLLMYIIKFFFGMIKCYINIILRIILAPLEIGMGAIPNSKMNFSTWIWNLVANLAVFPIAVIFLVLINVIVEAVKGKDLWHPPMFGGTTILAPALGFAGLMILAKLPTLIPEAIFQIKPSAFGKAVGEGLAPYSKNIGSMASGGAKFGLNTVGKQWDTDADGNTGARGAKGTLGRAFQFFANRR